MEMSSFYFLDTINKLTPTTKYYFASTTEMFSGVVGDDKYNELSKLYPKSVYGISKCLGFYFTQYFREAHGLYAVSGILSNHSNQYRDPSFAIKKITLAAAKIALGKQDSLSLGHLEWARDEVWADFAMEAAWSMLQLDKPIDIVVGNGDCKWGEEYVEHAFNYFNLNWRDYVKFDPQFLRKNEVVKLEVDPSIAIEKINWKPNRMTFEDHIKLMCQWDFEKESGGSPVRADVFNLY